MMGYPSAEASYFGSSSNSHIHTFGDNPLGKNGYVLDNIICSGNEASIFDCPRYNQTAGVDEWDNDCSAKEIAGVRCALK